ncbi:DUF6049 family protein [Luteococcus sp. OSA5]|uniref:DUF6049 family protein n=1 Tax=Luteococcus sp. OSA5 TaxID=3401630 RepID=UPI003B429DD6
MSCTRLLSRPAPGPGRVLPWWSALLAMVLCVAGLGVIRPSPSMAADPDSLSVVLKSVSPPSGTRDDTVTITGTVTNDTGKPVEDLQVHLWRSTDPIQDEDQLDQVLRSGPETPVGRRMVSAEAGNIFNITDVGDQPSQAFSGGKASFAPGESASFSVQAPVQGEDSLGFTAPGAYLVGIQLRGIPAGGQNQTLGRARSLFVLSSDDARVQPSTTLVHLASRPTQLTSGLFANNDLAAELRGRLRLQLALAQTKGTTLLVDPALVDELTAMAKGYTVRGITASTAEGQRAAKDFLAQLEPLLTQGRAYRTLYGSPDVQLASDGGRADLIRRAAAPLPADHPLAGLPLAVVPADGVLGSTAAQQVAALKPAVLLVSGADSPQSVQRWAASPTTSVVQVQPEVFDGGPGPSPSKTSAQVTGRLQATQFLAEQPVVTLVQSSAAAAAELAAAPWRTRAGLGTIVTDAQERPTWTPPSKTAPVGDATWMEALEGATAELEAWGELADEDSETHRRAGQILPQAVSTTWQRRRGDAVQWLSAVQRTWGGVLDTNRVRLHVVEDFVMSAPEQEIPVTIRNDLPEPVRVKVHFTSDNAQRISVTDSGPQRVGPGESVTVKMKVVTHANGTVGMTAGLTTVTGRPIGAERPLTVTATQMGRVGWIIIIASGAVFLIGTAMRIRQVQRERRGSTNVEAK